MTRIFRTIVAPGAILAWAATPVTSVAQTRQATGVFHETEGLSYRSAGRTGLTNARGEFTVTPQESVTFAVGDVTVGVVTLSSTSSLVTPAHLVAEVAGDVRKIKDRRVTNLARFLQSLDQDGNPENGVRIARETAEAVSRRRTIDFDQTESAFEADPVVGGLFAELKSPLRTGPQARNHLRRTLLGIRKLYDVRIPTRDPQVQLIADLFLPIAPGRFPVVLSATKYGKAFGRGCACTPQAALDSEKAEDDWYEYEPGPNTKPRPPNEVSVMPNSVDWASQGYALLRIDGRGSCKTPGLLHPYSAQEAEDNYDAIEWAATQPWSNGNVGMWGLSFTAASQLPVASLQPPHLKALIPHSADIDQYRDIVYQGGLYYIDYRENWFKNSVAGSPMRCLNQPFTNIVEIFRQNPFDDPRVYGPYRKDPKTGEQLPLGPVSPDPSKLTLPMWSHMRQDVWPIHVRGGSEVYIQAASKHKKLWVEAGHEYARAFDKETLALHVKFFDYWLKGIKNGIMDEPPVRLDIRLPRGAENPNGAWRTRFEHEWPLARTNYVKYYLDATRPDGDGALSKTPPKVERSTTYSADVEFGKDHAKLCSAPGVSFVSEPLVEDTELAGYMKLGLKVSSSSTDMDVYATLRVMDETGKEVFYHSTTSQASPVTLGFLKVSHRKLDPKRSTVYQPVHSHRREDHQPLVPNQRVLAEVELWPSTALIKKGHRLWLTIQPRDGCFAASGNLHAYDASYHSKASNAIHTGGLEPSYLQIPVIPAQGRSTRTAAGN